MTAIQFTLQSRNVKVGPMPVSTSSNETCPDACPLKRNGCYAETGPLGMLWKALSSATAGETFKRGRDTIQSLTWSQFCDKIAALPIGTMWRHNQAGDLPGQGDKIDADALRKLVDANQGKHGFTYTHKPLTSSNAAAIADANKRGFTVNLSADNALEADELKAAGIGPVVVVLPLDIQGKQDIMTPAGNRVTVCPATYLENVSCRSCGLCARADRPTIIGFPAHGASRKRASAVAS